MRFSSFVRFVVVRLGGEADAPQIGEMAPGRSFTAGPCSSASVAAVDGALARAQRIAARSRVPKLNWDDSGWLQHPQGHFGHREPVGSPTAAIRGARPPAHLCVPLLQQGESLTCVTEQMGHASIQITADVYGHLVPGR